MLLFGFAFLAGVVTVLSPCILPVLPVLAGGIAGGRGRPWGVISGFTLSFTVFTLTLSTLVQNLGLDSELLRTLAAVVILLFGLILVVPALKNGFLVWTSSFAVRRSPSAIVKPVAGYWPGLLLGLGLGLVWTPCVGPIMASVIALALTSSLDSASVLITLCYTLGTSLPMMGLMLGGRSLLARLPWLTRNTSGIQRVFGALMLLTSLALFSGLDRTFSTWLLSVFPGYGSGLTSIENQDDVKAALQNRRNLLASSQVPPATTADKLSSGQGDGVSPWLNSTPLSLASLKGKVVLVDFWTYSCINCVRTLPYLKTWYAKYKDLGFVIIGVHSPEFAFERRASNVLRAMSELEVSWPVVQDNAFGIWKAYENQYWPAHYLYGRDGSLLETHFGEGNYAQTEKAIAAALGVPFMPSGNVAGVVPVLEGKKTPETYLGFGHGARFASIEDVVSDQPSLYSFPTNLKTDTWALEGNWTIGEEFSASSAGSRLRLRFQGERVYLVIHALEGQAKAIGVSLDGKPYTGGEVTDGKLTLDADRLYQIVDQPGKNSGLLELEFSGRVQIYAFTFG